MTITTQLQSDKLAGPRAPTESARKDLAGLLTFLLTYPGDPHIPRLKAKVQPRPLARDPAFAPCIDLIRALLPSEL